MKIKWQEKEQCWYGAPKTAFPRFEAWRSNEAGSDPWCLDMVRSPNARPIKVRHLQSLDEAKEYARGLLAEFNWIGEDLPVGNRGEVDKRRIPQIAAIQPLPQTT